MSGHMEAAVCGSPRLSESSFMLSVVPLCEAVAVSVRVTL
jgi:hypothetical protein